MQGGEKAGVFSMNLLHVHGEAACLLHAAVDLCQLWHLCCISDSLQSFITEPTCTYSLWGEWHFITNWKVLTMPEVRGVTDTSKPKMQDLPQDPMDSTPRNSAAHLEAEALGATPTGRQSPKPCTSALCTASQSSRRESARQTGQNFLFSNFSFQWELTTGTRICLTLWGRQILCAWPGADSSEGKLLWAGQEWDHSCTICYPCTGPEDEQRLQDVHWVKRNAEQRHFRASNLCSSKDPVEGALQRNLLEYLHGISGTKNGLSWSISPSVSGLSNRHLHCLGIFTTTWSRCWNSHTTGLIFFHKPQSGWDINFFKVWALFLNMNLLV